MIYKALKAADTLEKEGISARIVNVSTLKPINEDLIKDFASGMRGIVTLEEHTIIGGLANIITYALRGMAIPVEAIAINDVFGQSSMDYEALLDNYGLNEAAVVNAAKRVLKKW
jgi:transketolase